MRPLPRHLALPVLALVASGCALPAGRPAGTLAPGLAAPPATAAQPSLPSLTRPGQSAERDIAPGEVHQYRLDLAAGQYVEIALEQKTSAQAATLTGPDGAVVAEAWPGHRERRSTLAAVVPAGGEHRLAVRGAREGQAGAYALSLVALRPPTPEDPARVAALRALAAAVERRDRKDPTDEVVKAFAAARELFRTAHDAAGEADSLNEVGVMHYNAGSYREATAAFEQALERARAAGYVWGEADSLNNLGGVLIPDSIRAAEAAADLQRAVDLWTEVDDPAKRAEASYNLGYCRFYSLRDLDGAAVDFARALELQERLGRTADAGYSLNGLGLVAQARGEAEEALRLYGSALERARLSGDGGLEATALRNQGIVQRARGELQEALASYSAALATGKAAPDTRAKTLHDLASLYFDLGDYEKAEAAYRQVLALSPEGDENALNALINLGYVRQTLGQPEAALELYRRALSLAGRSPRQEALAQLGLGRGYLDLGRPAEALAWLERALAGLRRNGVPAEQVRTLNNMSAALRRLGERRRAGEASDQALALARTLEDPTLTSQCLFYRAALDRDAGRLAEARAEAEEALKLVESVRHRVDDDSLRASFFAGRRNQYGLYIDLLMQLDRLHPGQGHAAEALAASEWARARGLLDLLAEGRIDVASGIDPELKQRETALARELAWTEDRLAAARGALHPESAEIDSLHRNLLDIERRQELLGGEIRQRNPRYAQVRYPTPLGAEAIRRLLDDRTALLEYALGEEVSYLFVVTRQDIEVHRLPATREIRVQVEELRHTLERPDRLRLGRYADLASALYRTLLAPAAGTLAARPELLIAPDGPLYLLPFEALLTGSPAASRGRSAAELPYLMRDHAVTYVPSASALAELREPRRDEPPPPAARKRFLAFADPDFAAASPAAPAPAAAAAVRSPGGLASELRSLPPLPGTEREVAGIAGLYPPGEVEIYRRGEASESNVKSNRLLETAARVHFATHGLVYGDRPQLSGLALAQGADPAEDGMLRVDEIFNLKLAADLVVLSACDTGGGKQVEGEGLVGLTQAFFYAGAPSLVVSLWPVSEDSTPELMIDFYRRLEAGEGKGKALRQAKLKLIGEGVYAHPFYWAPFVLIGDPRSRP